MAEVRIQKLEEELHLEKDIRDSTSILVATLVDESETQEAQLETLPCCFVQLGRCEL